MIKIVFIFFSFIFLIQCSAIRRHALKAQRESDEQYEKFQRGERPLLEVDFNGYVENMIYCFDNYHDDSAIKYIKWYPTYHSQLLNSFEYGVFINLFTKKSKREKEKYADFVEWYKNLTD